MSEFLHEIVRERNFNQDAMESVNTWVDPWDIPIPYALNMQGNLIDDIIQRDNRERDNNG